MVLYRAEEHKELELKRSIKVPPTMGNRPLEMPHNPHSLCFCFQVRTIEVIDNLSMLMNKNISGLSDQVDNRDGRMCLKKKIAGESNS